MKSIYDNDPEYLDTKKVAERFGLTVSWLTKNRIYALGPDFLPFVSIGSKVLYRTDAVREWLEARERKAVAALSRSPTAGAR